MIWFTVQDLELSLLDNNLFLHGILFSVKKAIKYLGYMYLIKKNNHEMHSFIMFQCFFVVSKYYLSYNVTVKLSLN